VRRAIGIIFQTPSLDQNLTGEENIRLHAVMYGVFPYRPLYRFMPSEYRARVGDLAGLLGMKDDIFKPVRTYSGGMKRKLEIVRSLMHRPRVLFLDEPTSGLDVASRRSLWQYLREVRERSGTTLLLTTHYLEEAEDADEVCIIDRGHVVAHGSPAEVKGTAGNALKLEDAYLRILAEQE
jgi:ABC-2 type transport system ATP-binding protein